MSLLFGNLINSFVKFGTAINGSQTGFHNQTVIDLGNSFKHTAAKDASGLVYVGVGIFVTTYIYMVVWTHNGKALFLQKKRPRYLFVFLRRAGEVLAKRVRENYLKAVLRQEIAFFDNVGAGEIATRIQTDTREHAHFRINSMGLFVFLTASHRFDPARHFGKSSA